MKIAIEGCAHGQMETIYDTIQYLETEKNIKVDLLLCCGDFQATRNLDDLNCMACPPKYREICSFYKYYSGEKLAPVLTIFIGGNHEASNYLQELPYGGWVAPNIYYLGYAGVVNICGIRIAGLSGIFHGGDYCKGKYEKPPYNADSLRSCYHIRNLDIFRLKQLAQPVNIMLTHDWPAGIYNHGDTKELLRMKPFFQEDIQNLSLGSKPSADLLNHMKPDYWFSAHLHVKFAALVEHKDNDNKKITKFLALDKCLPRRKFLQIIDIACDKNGKQELEYDLEWLTVLHMTNHLLSIKKINCYMPSSDCNERFNFTPSAEEMELVRRKFENNLKIPQNFVPTAPAYDPNWPNPSEGRLFPRMNPQTVDFCAKLGVHDPMALLLGEGSLKGSNTSFNAAVFDTSSFVTSTDSEADVSSSSLRFGSPIKGRQSLKTPLKLPKPLNSSDIADDCLTSTPKAKSINTDHQVTGDSMEKSEPTTAIAPGPGTAKFRRRNFEIYASKDEEI